MHKTAIVFALRHKFRLGRDRLGYCLHGADSAIVARPAWGETTAAGALRMMRRELRVGFGEAQASSNAFVIHGRGIE